MKRQQIVKYCDRCPLGKNPVRAVRTIRFGFGDTWWDIDVCEKHGDMLERELYAWGMLARAVEEKPATRFSADYSSSARRVAELRTAQTREDRQREDFLAANGAPVASTGARELLAQAGRQDQLGAPHDAGEYVFTDHAIERMAERNVKAVEALWAASAPTVKFPGKHKGLMVHERAGVKVVVNPATKVIITVGADKRDEAIAQ